jgi:hypothetical protein
MIWRICFLLIGGVHYLHAYALEGEISLMVRDPAGAALAAHVKLQGVTSRYRAESDTDDGGRWRAKHIPFGPYFLEVTRDGFAPYTTSIEIRSEIPQVREITLGIQPIETSIQVLDAASLVDPRQTGTVFQVERRNLQEQPFSTPGRGAANLLNSFPGWLLEANAVVHPRGSEYDTQYVIDGMPLTDNRSPAFAPSVELEGLEEVRVFTSNIPAEYGRRLGGVVELFTRRNDQPGNHPELLLRGGSFSSAEGSVSDSLVSGRTAIFGAVRLGATDRFLDPPALENFTNHAGMGGATLRIERDLSPRDRIEAYLQTSTLHFLVPNDPVQQEAGQRQDRRNAETGGRLSFHHVFSSQAVGSVRAMVRDLSSRLWSNPEATPVIAAQDRGFREAYVSGAFTLQKASHLLKFGADVQTAGLHENFAYQEAAADADSAPGSFAFQSKRRSRELGAFAQDHWQLGRLTLDLGLRWDYYGLLVRERAWSPRLGAAYHWAAPGLVLHASYDRAFQPPAMENLLLTSAFQGLPVHASRGNFYEVGIRKGFGRLLRIEANHFWRRFRNFADDDVFLNTGISFPIAFDRARIEGTELRIDVPGRHGLSGFASWSNQAGLGYLPLTGGLFIGQDAGDLLQGRGSFPITQDQRNTARAQARWQIHPRVWTAVASQYSSGLPVQLEPGAAPEEFAGRVSERVLDRVNFGRGRIRPAFSTDVSAGAELWKGESGSVRLQIDLSNAANRLNLINFSGLLSGTAIAAPRTVGVQLRMQF